MLFSKILFLVSCVRVCGLEVKCISHSGLWLKGLEGDYSGVGFRTVSELDHFLFQKCICLWPGQRGDPPTDAPFGCIKVPLKWAPLLEIALSDCKNVFSVTSWIKAQPVLRRNLLHQ